jgi:hypothetical protein
VLAAGLIGAASWLPAHPSPAPVRSVFATSAPSGRVVPGTPCTATAAACVDLTSQRAWLITGGTVARGPVPVHSGGPGQATPQGTFTVSWKDPHHVSRQLGIAMPDSVFFAAGGIAFHEGPLTHASAGCVHLRPADAAAFYAALHRGAQVQVMAPGGDTAAGVTRPAAPHAGAPRTRHAQPGIPGVAAIGPAPRT